ncbi:hypothetical protein [Kerstersia gyiorum]|uniref:Uncharacterized protein n=1 Tax=Kerstersia gyiorum TaxID=206506 RepID=A0A171KSG2_9BURK|nr:hypothetical protein [Kerstersia gyiorum]KKO71829.1 hypothetical protein AAV32_09660 [Kerstersia gyiorum]
MELIHTSPSEIKEIRANGRFDSFLFFSAHEYSMSVGQHVAYSIEIDEDQIIEASRLFYHDGAEKLQALVDDLASRYDIDSDDAEALIEGKISAHDIIDDADEAADASWDAQLYAARAAVLLGYRGVAVEDEQGMAYMIDMLGRESELSKIGE